MSKIKSRTDIGNYVIVNSEIFPKHERSIENRVFKIERKLNTPLIEVDKHLNVSNMILFEGVFHHDETITLINDKDIIKIANTKEVRRAKEKLLNHMAVFRFMSHQNCKNKIDYLSLYFLFSK